MVGTMVNIMLGITSTAQMMLATPGPDPRWLWLPGPLPGGPYPGGGSRYSVPLPGGPYPGGGSRYSGAFAARTPAAQGIPVPAFRSWCPP